MAQSSVPQTSTVVKTESQPTVSFLCSDTVGCGACVICGFLLFEIKLTRLDNDEHGHYILSQFHLHRSHAVNTRQHSKSVAAVLTKYTFYSECLSNACWKLQCHAVTGNDFASHQNKSVYLWPIFKLQITDFCTIGGQHEKNMMYSHIIKRVFSPKTTACCVQKWCYERSDSEPNQWRSSSKS